jgi:hypothetical protein
MTNRRDPAFFPTASLTRAAALGMIMVAGLALPACEKKQAPQQQPAPAPAPAPKPVASLDGVKLHPKVQFPDTSLPSSQEAVDAIAALAGAMASGDAAAMQRLLGERDQAVLKTLVETGEWQRQADSTKVVRICSIKEEGSTVRVGIALQDAMGAFLTGWEATSAGDAWVFGGIAIAPKLGVSAADLDGAELALLELPKGLALSSVELRAAEPPPRIVRETKSGGGGPGGGSPPPNRRLPRIPQ